MLGTLFGFIIQVLKTTLFTILVLIAGQLVHWRGQPISSHVRDALVAIENWSGSVKRLAEDARDRAGQLGKEVKITSTVKETSEKISAEERARLQKIFHN